MTKETKIIRGAGGGNRGRNAPPSPVNTPDTLDSRTFAIIQDLLSEGEIAGIHDPGGSFNSFHQSIFLNDTPIQNADGSENFTDITVHVRHGDPNQDAISGITNLGETRSPTAVGVTVTNATGNQDGATLGSVTRQITNTDVDAVIVTLTWPQIQLAKSNGDILGDKVVYEIRIQYQGGGFSDIVTTFVEGRTADSYQRDHRITLDHNKIQANQAFPVDIRVERVTRDSTETNKINAFEFTSFQEVIDNKSTYPNSAYTQIRVDSKTFSSIPTRKFRIRGIKVKIPGVGALGSGTPSVDPATGRIVYPSGYIFDGLMGAATYTNCPAMCLLDLLTNKRYGLGNHIEESNLDLFSFVAASKFANELVDDGTGTNNKEARFSCNVNIQSPKEAFDAINELSGIMRCMPIWSAGGITLSQDKPTNATYLFNLSNVGEGGFNYSGSSLKTRHTIISVSYFNMDSREIDFEIVGDDPDNPEDQARQNKFGAITKKVQAFGCTSRGQAARLGRAILFAEQNESETVTFTTSIDSGLVVRPGSVIEINDPVRSGARRGGRVVSATTTAITIDAASETSLPSLSDNPTISVMLSNGTVEVGTISDITGAVITVNSVDRINDQGEKITQSVFSSVPKSNAPYVISSTTLQTQLFRVIQVEEQDDVNYVITALSYVEGKYSFIENQQPLPVRNISILDQPAPTPTNLKVTEEIFVVNNVARTKLIIDWRPVAGVYKYQVNYRFENNNFISTDVYSSDFEIIDSLVGTYTIEVYSYNAALRLSTLPNKITFEAIGKTQIPEDPTTLTVEPISDLLIRLRYPQSISPDVIHGGTVEIRHTSNLTQTATFENSIQIIAAQPGNSTECIVPALTGAYSIKYVDDGGRRSKNAARVFISQPDAQPRQIILTRREDLDTPKFSGEKFTTIFDNVLDGLKIDGIALFDFIPDIESLPNFDLSGPTSDSGSYNFENKIDLEGKFNLNLKRHFDSVATLERDLFDNRIALINTWTDFDGEVNDDVDASVLVATTDSDPDSSFSGTYSQSAKTITITKSNHGLTFGSFVEIEFDTGNASEILASYAQTGDTVTVTKSNHGLSFNDIVKIKISSGLGSNGVFTITNVPNVNTFEYKPGGNNQSTSGNCVINNIDGEYEIVNVPTSNTFVVLADTSTTTSGNCTFGAGFTQFNTFANGEYTARGFKFKTILTTKDPAQNIIVKELGYEATMPRRIETINTSIASGSSAKTVTFEHPFFIGTGNLGGTSAYKPTIGITLEGAVSGDYFKITSITGTQFVIEVRDGSDAFKNLNFKYTAIGFGKGL